MEWTTRSHLHLDRTASAWLIRRFVDQQAEFLFVDWDQAADANDPRAFAIPGASLSGHDENGTCFAKIVRAHGLERDPALRRIDASVAAGVRHALGMSRTEADPAAYRLGLVLDSIGLGLSLLHDDESHLAAATPLYDALYASFLLPEQMPAELPPTQPERVAYLRSLIGLPHNFNHHTAQVTPSHEGDSHVPA